MLVEMDVQDLMQELHRFNKKFASAYHPKYSIGEFMDECFREDSEDGSLICAGWVFGEGDAYFRNEQSAETYRKVRYGCTIAELYDDEASEVYWTEWYEFILNE